MASGAQGLVPQARPFGLAVVLELAEGLAGPLPAVEVLRFDQRMPVLLPRIPNWPRRHEEPEPRNRPASSVTHATHRRNSAISGLVAHQAAGPSAESSDPTRTCGCEGSSAVVPGPGGGLVSSSPSWPEQLDGGAGGCWHRP
jgi:hypothetical protein